jgi:hypothetical protein
MCLKLWTACYSCIPCPCSLLCCFRYIHISQLPYLIEHLEPPLGVKGLDAPRVRVQHLLMSADIPARSRSPGDPRWGGGGGGYIGGEGGGFKGPLMFLFCL